MSQMADSKAQAEPSIEEILSSIRQIINEDTDAPDEINVAPTAPTKPSPMVDNDDDILDLASIAKPALPPQSIAPKPAPAPEPEPEPEAPQIDVQFEEPKAPVFEAPPAPEPVAPAPAPEPVEGEGLLSQGAMDAAVSSLTRLAQAEIKIDHRHAAGLGSVTLEDVVTGMLRPMMKAWLDENLPPLVEKLVQREIEKMSKRV